MFGMRDRGEARRAEGEDTGADVVVFAVECVGFEGPGCGFDAGDFFDLAFWGFG